MRIVNGRLRLLAASKLCATLLGTILAAALALPARAEPKKIEWKVAPAEAAEKLQAYIRVDTSNPPGNETTAVELLRGWLEAEGIEARLYDPMGNPARQALVARLPGRSGRTIVLMSHSDVVPAVAAEWRHPPFAGEVEDDVMYGRGVVDTKELGILQLMTLILLHRQGLMPRDELLWLVEPDEEENSAGIRGMLEKYPELFRNVRMVLNEGGFGTVSLLNKDQVIFFVQTAEKGAAWMKLTAHGPAAHGSVPRPDNAVVAMVRALDRIAAYQTPLRPSPAVIGLFKTLADQQPFPNSFVLRHVDNPIVQWLFRDRITERPFVNALLRTTISPTSVHGGYKTNVIPAEVEATLDCRVTEGDSGEALKRNLERLVNDPQVTFELINNETPTESPPNQELMATVRTVTSKFYPGSLVAPLMSSGATDSAPFRRRNIPAYGFNPVVLSEAELNSAHGIDEHLTVRRFFEAVRLHYEIVTQLAGAE